MQPLTALAMILRSLLRARARSATTLIGCTIGAAVVVFFLTAQAAMDRASHQAGDAVVLQVAQQDRF
jgi:hypothetical protein